MSIPEFRRPESDEVYHTSVDKSHIWSTFTSCMPFSFPNRAKILWFCHIYVEKSGNSPNLWQITTCRLIGLVNPHEHWVCALVCITLYYGACIICATFGLLAFCLCYFSQPCDLIFINVFPDFVIRKQFASLNIFCL